MTREDGTMAIAMTGLVAIVAVLTIAVAALGVLYAARAQATNAADAAALAAAVATYPPVASASPPMAARRMAQANGARLLGCDCTTDSSLDPRTVTVTAGVEADVPLFGPVTVRVSSRAEFDPLRWLGR
ncbi:MAG TPA: pilus assembly protein TadG-related protein [Acidimicrobiia bacterium]|nr:pilus assembly protein TadG-related protein [Acidimicrobiia bacterium]